MTNKELIELKKELESEESSILGIKGEEYAVGDSDRLKFFKDYADKLGISTQMVCAVFLLKHINSILEYAKTGNDSAEGIISRINDARNYLLFMAALENDSLKESDYKLELSEDYKNYLHYIEDTEIVD